MPEQLRVEFGRLKDVTSAANDEMRVTNDRLENSIAKLEHKPQNNLKLAIDEAAVAAEHLADKLDKSFQSFLELVKASASGILDRMLFHQTNDKDIEDLIGGKSGIGGMKAAVYNVTRSGGDPTSTLADYRGRAQHMLHVSQYSLDVRSGKRAYEPQMGPWDATSDLAPRMEKLRALLNQIDAQSDSYKLEKDHTALTARAQVPQAGAAANKQGESAEKKWQREAAEFDKKGDEAELDAIGKIYYARDQLLTQGEKLKRSEKELAEVRESADKQVAKIYDPSRIAFLQYDATRERGPNLKPYLLDHLRDLKEGFTAQDRIEDIGVQAQKAELQRQASKAGRMAELEGGTDREIAEKTYQTRVNLALQLAGIGSGPYPTPGGPNTSGGTGPMYVAVNVDGQGLAPFMTGSYVTSNLISDQMTAAQNASYGRTQQAANSVLPGLTIA